MRKEVGRFLRSGAGAVETEEESHRSGEIAGTLKATSPAEGDPGTLPPVGRRGQGQP